ncbi:MAG: hypothetical protein QN716_10375, partial [Nitrososphaeraceae archaeon]|nr:hypothetical protein [Nitrososphaeraceae archaeon]
MVSGSPTASGFAGYFSAGTKNHTNHIIPARIKVFLMFLFEWGNNKDLLYTITIPNNAPNDIPKIVPAAISPPFFHK